MPSIVKQFSEFRESRQKTSGIVAEFKKFRDKREAGAISFTPVTSPPERPSMFELEELKKLLMEDEQFRGFVTPEPRWFGNGAGVAPSRVAALESRILSLEANGGGSASINYLSVTEQGTTTYNSELVTGINIIGVNAPGPVTIRLPDNIEQGTIIEINDESLNAGTNNITIETYIAE